MTPVRVGILGTGNVVRSSHLPALASNPRASVVAIGNHRAESMQAVASRFGIRKSYTDFDRMAQDPEIDAVVNALPNYLHAPVTIKMLAGGKHVLCEKPMAMTAMEGHAMVRAAELARRTLMIAHVWRSSPEVQWLRDVVRAGTLGTIFKVKAHAVVVGRGPALDSWFVRRETAGGSALADVGIHGLDTISFLFDDRVKPVRVFARVGNYFQQLEVEDSATAMIEYDNGMTAQVEAGWYHAYASDPHGAIELFGTKGYARTMPPRLCRRAGDIVGEESPAVSSNHPDRDGSIYEAQMNYFLDCVLEERQPTCSGTQGIRNQFLLETAYRSARRGESIFIGLSEPNGEV